MCGEFKPSGFNHGEKPFSLARVVMLA